MPTKERHPLFRRKTLVGIGAFAALVIVGAARIFFPPAVPVATVVADQVEEAISEAPAKDDPAPAPGGAPVK